jgi:hypothetical protein
LQYAHYLHVLQTTRINPEVYVESYVALNGRLKIYRPKTNLINGKFQTQNLDTAFQ